LSGILIILDEVRDTAEKIPVVVKEKKQ